MCDSQCRGPHVERNWPEDENVQYVLTVLENRHVNRQVNRPFNTNNSFERIHEISWLGGTHNSLRSDFFLELNLLRNPNLEQQGVYSKSIL